MPFFGAPVSSSNPSQLNRRTSPARHSWISAKAAIPPGLTFGGCFAYPLAKVSGEPLLFKGNDFLKTDIVPAL